MSKRSIGFFSRVAFLLFVLAGNAAAQDPSAAPALPSGACQSLKMGEMQTAFDRFLGAAPAVEQLRLASRFRFLPKESEVEVVAYEPYDAGVRYRVFVGNGGTPEPVEPRRVWAERAPIKTGSDAGDDGDRTEKTLIHFTPVAAGTGDWWGRARVYVLGCSAEGVPVQLGQFQTNITTKPLCRILAIFLCALFYLMAVLATYRIRAASRTNQAQDAAALGNMKGNNYASIWQHFDPVVLTANQNGRGSATKMQLLFFSVLVFGLTSYIWMSTGYLSNLSTTILSLLGISGVGAIAAGATDNSRKRLAFDNWAWLINRSWLPKGGVAEVNQAQWKDIVMTNNEFDVSRFQMITFSVLVGMSLLTAGGETADLSNFTIPEAFLGILGLSQAVYVAGKFVDAPSISQLNDQITLLRTAETTLRTALAESDRTKGWSDARGLPVDRSDLSLRVGNAYDQYLETWETTRTMFESTLSESVSAVAEGIRPPFPYLSLPADALAALVQKYDEVNSQLMAIEATPAAATATGGAPPKIQQIQAARQAFLDAQQAAKDALAEFAQKPAPDAALSGRPGDTPNARAAELSSAEKRVRAMLDQLRQRLVDLQRLVATP